MDDLNLFRPRWDFLQALHPLFLLAESLPTVEDAGQGNYGSMSAEDIDPLKNEITMLRNDFKLNIIKQQLVDMDHLTEGDFKREKVQPELEFLLEELEDLVDPRVHDIEQLEPTAETESLSYFPKLVMLRKLLRKNDSNADFEDNSQAGIPDLIDTDMVSLDTESSWDKRYLRTSVEQAASYIRFPQEADQISSCRRRVSRFGIVLDKMLGDSVGLWKMEAQTLDYTPQDVAAIKYASDFSSTCTSLFDHIVDGAKCGTRHQARLHLSGFKEDQLRMNIDMCQDTGSISALFTRSSETPSSDMFNFNHMCSHSSTLQIETQMVHIAFNSLSMWEHVPPDHSAGSDSTGIYSGQDGQFKSLEDLLNHEDLLKLKYRKLAGVLLASSLFQLSGSPWIEQYLGPDTIFVPLPNNKQLHQWCPHIVCTLAPKETTKLQSDDIAAFGVLVLELEANRKAPWTREDTDWISGQRSNHVRLARILKAWEDVVSDDYRDVAKVCLEFDSLVESLDHPDIVSDQKGIAVIYKCILEPLFRQLMNSFGRLAPLFDGIFNPCHLRSLTAMRLSASNTAKRVLFDDDDESMSKPDDRITASTFLKDLRVFFDKISGLGRTISLTDPFGREKIRIAVLDSGVDDTDPMIRGSIRFGRINASKSKSFVGRPNEWQDITYGHGTHVTRLLLETAPAAEIYIGKICTGKMVNDEYMPGIAKAIDWAVEECNADIISLSFGFEDENELIDEAIERAVDAGKLIFAAASNNGGLAGRARPARSEAVLCVHASDGKGNKGGMNPSPVTDRDNFTTLGVAVPSRWKGHDVWKSGTSFATPIAAGFAADVLAFADYKCTNLKAGRKKLLRKKRGMQAIFKKMAEKRDGYDFIHPGRLWQNGKTEQEVARDIEDIMRGL